MGKPFTVQLMRSMPYPSTWFLVYIGGSTSPAALISKVSGGFKRSTDVLEYKEGGSRIIRQGPARTKYEPITLERGVTQDIDFMNWANAVQVLDKGSPSSSLKNLRQNLRIDLLREDLVPVKRFYVYRAWPSEYQALPDLDAGANTVAIEHLKLVHEGWEQDLTLPEPAET
jgi:phage tail-like protein